MTLSDEDFPFYEVNRGLHGPKIESDQHLDQTWRQLVGIWPPPSSDLRRHLIST